MPFEQITSLQNPSVKKIVELREPKARRESGLIVIDGLREVSMALNAGVKLERVYYCPKFLNPKDHAAILEKISKSGAEILEASDAVFHKIAFGDRQEMVAVAKAPQSQMGQWTKIKNPLYIVLETLEKPGNLGAILRTAEAAGVSGVIVCEKKTDIYNPNVIRSSLGTVFTVAVTATSNEECLEFLRERRVVVAAAFPSAKKFYTQVDLSKPAAVILGSEGQGLTDFWDKAADEKIKIPLLGKVDSLNVSVSAAVIIYESLRQRSH